MAPRSPARWLAPLALVAAGLALVAILASSDSDPEPPVTPPPASTATTQAKKKPAPKPATAATGATGTTGEATYTVQAGDYLSTVAEKTGVPVDRLRELNPGLDANSMTVGQKIKLR